MKLNIQSMHTPGLLLATNLVQLANSIAHARSLVAAAYSHAREIATAEANHEAADFCGDPYAHNCGRPHCRPSDSYTGPQPPLVRRFFEVDAIAEAAPPAAGVPEGWRELAQEAAEALQVFTGHDSGPNLRHRYGKNWWEPLDQLRDKLRAMLKAPAPPASEQQRAAVMPDGWKAVPIEPTPEMREAFHDSYERYEDGYGECPDSQWKAMLRVAPTPPQENDR